MHNTYSFNNFLKCSEIMCFEEIYKWLIIERYQAITEFDALRFIEKSIMFVNADVEYLDFNTSMELYSGFNS